MNATTSGQGAANRFIVKLVSPAGTVVSEQGYDDPQVAMLAFFELTQSRFGDKLGAGAYAALVDEQLEFCSGWTAEGKGTYATRFYREAGHSLFLKTEELATAATGSVAKGN